MIRLSLLLLSCCTGVDAAICVISPFIRIVVGGDIRVSRQMDRHRQFSLFVATWTPPNKYPKTLGDSWWNFKKRDKLAPHGVTISPWKGGLKCMFYHFFTNGLYMYMFLFSSAKWATDTYTIDHNSNLNKAFQITGKKQWHYYFWFATEIRAIREIIGLWCESREESNLCSDLWKMSVKDK